MRNRAPRTGHLPPWRAAAARQEARSLSGSAGAANPPHPVAMSAAMEESWQLTAADLSYADRPSRGQRP